MGVECSTESEQLLQSTRDYLSNDGEEHKSDNKEKREE